MTKNITNSILWGVLLLLIGVVGLLYNFGVLDPYKTIAAYVVAGLLAVAGVAFLVIMAFQQDRWLFVIPGLSFLSLASVVYLTTLESIEAVWLGALFLAGIAAGFLVLFLSNRTERWWALLQAGTIGVIAVVGLGVGVPEESEKVLGSALFGGFSLSFFLLWLFTAERRRFLWALIMAGVLAIFSATLIAAAYGEANLIVNMWPVVLMLLGALVLGRLFTGRSKQATQPAAPTVPVETLEAQMAGTASASSGEPARIILPDGMSPPEAEIVTVEPATPDPEPIPPPPADALPDQVADADLSDPSAALDALLQASKKTNE